MSVAQVSRAISRLQRDSQRAGTGADIEHAPRAARQFQRDFHHVLGLRARDQHVRRHAEIAAVEFLMPGDVLRGLAAEPFVQVAAVVQPLHLAQFLLGVGVKVDALDAAWRGQQHFRRQPRHGDAAILQDAACPAATRCAPS